MSCCVHVMQKQTCYQNLFYTPEKIYIVQRRIEKHGLHILVQRAQSNDSFRNSILPVRARLEEAWQYPRSRLIYIPSNKPCNL